MKLQPKKSICEYFSSLEDPRVERKKRHKLIDIITITICAVISGADTWVDIEAYKEGKITCERRYYISSCSNNAENLAEATRGYWGIENQLNWVLDVQFQEDDSRIKCI